MKKNYNQLGIIAAIVFLGINIYQMRFQNSINISFNDNPILYFTYAGPIIILLLSNMGFYRYYISSYGNYLLIRYGNYRKIYYYFQVKILITSIALTISKILLELLVFHHFTLVITILFFFMLIIMQNLQFFLEILISDKISIYCIIIYCLTNLTIGDYLFNLSYKMFVPLFLLNNTIMNRLIYKNVSILLSLILIIISYILNYIILKRKEIY